MPARSADKAPLSRERVLAAALSIADTEGLASLTMRRVAETLDCEPMSLYYYVADKKALLAALLGDDRGRDPRGHPGAPRR